MPNKKTENKDEKESKNIAPFAKHKIHEEETSKTEPEIEKPEKTEENLENAPEVKKDESPIDSSWKVRRLESEQAHYNDRVNRELLEHLGRLGLIDVSQIDKVMEYHNSKQENIAESIVNMGLMKDAEIGRVIADYFGVTYINLKNSKISSEIVHLIPEEVSKNEMVLTYQEDDQSIHMAMINPTDQHFIHLVEKKTGKKVIPDYATPKDLTEAQQVYRQDALKGFDHLIARATEDISKLETLQNISNIFDTLVLMAYYKDASDIHIEPFEKEIRIRIRVDGVLKTIAILPIHFLDTMVNHVKVLSKLRTDEHNSAQDGRFKVTFDNSSINFRVSILPSYYGEKMVLRLLSSESQESSLEELGYSQKDINTIQRNIEKTQGMNLITGPTGSGKTTTLYSILTNLNNEDVNISTIEDPIEYGLYGMNQVQVNLKTNLTFADGLRSLLRQDPDIIMIGEIRDIETAKISAHASLTGHLIFATLHTSNAALAPLRMIQMGLDPYLIVSTLNLIVAQRLARKICNSCRVTSQMSEEELKRIEEKFFTNEKEIAMFREKFINDDGSYPRLYKGKGCEECSLTGFKGRTVIAEVMELNQTLRNLIVSESSQEKIEEEAIKNGMTTMLEDGFAKVLEGRTTLDELLRIINQ